MKRPAKKCSKVAAAVPSGGRGDIATPDSGSNNSGPAAGTAATTAEAEPKPISKASAGQRERWRKVRAGELPNPDQVARERWLNRPINPLFSLSKKLQDKVYLWMRECSYVDSVLNMLKEEKVDGVTADQVSEFFEEEAVKRWEMRNERAAQEANALVRAAEKHPADYSSAVLQALGQEAFRQVSSGEIQPDAMSKITNIFLRARSAKNADQMQELKREKVRQELQDGLEHAMERLFEEVEKHPAAQEAFDSLRRELAGENEELGRD